MDKTYTADSTGAEQKRESDIQDSLKGLGESISKLEAIVDMLDSRLVPIKLPRGEDTPITKSYPSPPPIQPSKSLVREKMNNLTDFVDILGGRISNIVQDLDI